MHVTLPQVESSRYAVLVFCLVLSRPPETNALLIRSIQVIDDAVDTDGALDSLFLTWLLPYDYLRERQHHPRYSRSRTLDGMNSAVLFVLAGARGGDIRLCVLEALDDSAQNTQHLAETLNVSQSTLAYHLTVL